MSQEIFVWDENKYGCNEVVQEGIGWGIFNEGCLAIQANDGEVYNFPPESISYMSFLKATLTFQGAVCVKIAPEYAEFANEKYGTDLISLDGYNGWNKLKKYQNTVGDIILLANILNDNGISVVGDYDKFYKMWK